MKGDPILPLVRRVLCGLFEFAILGTALICGVAAVAAQGGRWNHRLDLLTHFAPAWLAGGAVCLLIGVFIRRGWLRGVTAVFSAAAIASAGNLMWMDLVRVHLAWRADPAARTLKLIEFNAWDKNPTPQRVARWLAQEDPDVVVIAEASPLLEREIAASTKLHLFHGSGVVIATRDKPLSEHVAWEARALPGAPTEFAWVELSGPGRQRFTVVGVHCLWPIPSRTAWGQDRNIAALLATQDRSSAILAGDFNSTQWSFRQRDADVAFGVERRDLALPTWPARLPMLGGRSFPLPILAIDHVYAGSSWKTVSVKLGPNLGSDHYPLVGALAWAPG